MHQIFISGTNDQQRAPGGWCQKSSPLSQILTYYKRLGFKVGERFIIRASGQPQLYFFGQLGQDNIRLWETTFHEERNGLKVYRAIYEIENPVNRLRELGKTHDIHSYPNHLAPYQEGELLLGSLGNRDAKKFTSFFWEIDDLPLDVQTQKRQWLLEQTGIDVAASIFSGGKSEHNYLASSVPCTASDWERINRKLVIAMEGDTAIVTLARAMRVPGVPRVKDGMLQEVELLHESQFVISPQALETILNELQPFPYGLSQERWRKLRSALCSGKNAGLSHSEYWAEAKKILLIPEADLNPQPAPSASPREFKYSGDTIPLEICLSRNDQDLIAHGVSAGSLGRNPMGYKLARNAIATAAKLNELGIRHSDNGYQLLEDFCHRCNPPLPDREIQRLWSQAQKSNPKAPLKEDQLLKRVSWWQWQQLPPNEQRKYTGEPDPLLYAKYVQELEEEERVAQSQYQEYQRDLKVGIGRWLGQTIKGVLGKAKGFGKKTVTRRKVSAPPRIICYPQGQLPRPEDYEGRPLPRITFKKGKRLQVLAELKQLGWKFVCDKSFTGSGKSHDAGLLYPDPEGTGKIWYFDQNHTNPSTETTEGMANMPPRHNGMAQVPGKFTPKGHPHLKWAKEDEIPITPSLCHNAELFVKLKSKGWDIDSQQDQVKSDAGESLSRNPICKQCRFSYKCHQEEGEGYGYLAARRAVMEESRRIRASLDSAPNPEGEKKYDYSQDTAFVEEASRYLRGTTTLTAWGNELAQLWEYVERKAPEAFAALQPIRFALQDALNGDFDCVEKGLNRGADHETLVNELPHPSAIANLPNLIQQVREAMPSIQDVVEKPDSVTGLGGAYRKIGQFTRDLMKSQAAHQTKQNIEALPPNVLIDALEIWAGIKTGSLRVNHKQLQVTVQHSRHADILTACGFVALLDATPNSQYLEKILGDRVLEIEEERSPLSNLTVINVNMKGLGSNQISDTCKTRQLALLDWITQQHQQVKVLANKVDSHLPLDGWWFNDNRGSNAFKGVEALAAFNMPRPNLGVIQDEYRALFGSLEGFENYYQGLVEAEIVQIGGRLRVHLYPEREFTLYLASSNQDLSYLTDLGCRVEDKEAVELTPLAGTPDQITRWKIFQAVGQLESQGLKITQDSIALLIGKSQGLISKIAKEFGDWKAFKKLLLVLLGLYRGSNNFSELNENERSLIQEYLSPVVDVSVAAIESAPTEEELDTTVEALNATILQCIADLGFLKFLEGVRGMSPVSQSNLLSVILRGGTDFEFVEGS